MGDGGDSFTAAFRPACFSIWLTLPSSGHRRRGHFDLPESVTKRALPSHCTWYMYNLGTAPNVQNLAGFPGDCTIHMLSPPASSN